MLVPGPTRAARYCPEHSLQMTIVKSPTGLCLIALSFQAYDRQLDFGWEAVLGAVAGPSWADSNVRKEIEGSPPVQGDKAENTRAVSKHQSRCLYMGGHSVLGVSVRMRRVRDTDTVKTTSTSAASSTRVRRCIA